MSFTVYKSSAGSGKTFMLVKEYLKIILHRPQDFKHILAITFTNKAAAEMKSRIINALHDLSAVHSEVNGAETLLRLLVKETNLSEQIIKERASIALKLILHNYSDFAVSTIDSFYHGIVRSFAKDLHIPVNFEIELDSMVLLNQAVDILISRVGSDEVLTEILVRFIESKAEDSKGLDIEKNILNTGSYIFKEESIEPLEKLRNLSLKDLNSITQKVFSQISIHENAIAHIASQAIQMIDVNNISHDAFYNKSNGLYNYFMKIKKGNLNGIYNKTIDKGVQTDKWTNSETSIQDKTAIDSIKGNLLQYYTDIQNYANNNLKHFELLKLMAKNAYPLSVINELARIIEEIKTENNLLHISEFNKKIADIIMNEPVPFIYERIGAKFKHYMVDEFQDTSILQWTNLLPLIENALSESGFTMIVGDGKQAIYRWRDGEVEQFMSLPNVYAKVKKPFHYDKEQTLTQYYNPQKLIENFRSRIEIVNFNNSFFTFAKSFIDDKFRIIYDDVEQKPQLNKEGGLVSINFLEQEELHEQMLAETKNLISEMTLNEGINPGNIAVLCRTNEKANAIARHLMENGINVVSNESLLLKNSPLVSFMTATIEYIENTENVIALSCMFNFLIKSNKIENYSFHEIITGIKTGKRTSYSYFNEFFNGFSVPELQNLPVYELCETLIRIFNLNDKPNPYLQFFLDEVLQFSIGKYNSLKDFLDYWDENCYKFSVVIPVSEDAVKIMSIHKSKGLQFPIVIYPFAKDSKKITNKDNIWIEESFPQFPELPASLLPMQKDLEATIYKDLYETEKNKSRLDLLNLMYVALTRAEERLYVLTEKPSEDKNNFNIHYLLMNYLKSVNLWKEDSSLYKFGEIPATINNKPLTNNSAIDKKLIFDSLISSPWQKKIVLTYNATTLWDIENPDQRFRYGNLIHLAMSLIASKEDIDKALNKMHLEGLIEKDEIQNLKIRMEKIVFSSELKNCFEKNTRFYNEKELLDMDGHIYRPDRMVFFNNNSIIIDYKTGKPEEKHKEQIRKYADILHRTGVDNITNFLVYIDAHDGKEIEIIEVI
ncbi:MAG: UvrD-helicase domain-containing protein [Bacteroidales bacterium]|nr:UvrD-helicase domain-containing protein [Bacteroidales bacterium]